MNRLQFLRGQYSAESAARPPWSVLEQQFVELCDRCDACIQSCPSHVIKRGTAGFPEMNFSGGGCDFCEACAVACTRGAIMKTQNNMQQPWDLSAVINRQCFSQRGIVCRSCGEICEQRAIRFRPVVGGITMLEISSETCNGCGECVSICPAQAIAVQPEPILEAQS